MKSFPSSTINVSKDGSAFVLGELESLIMDAIWQLENANVQDIRKKLAEKRVYSFNTIMTVMNILTDKGLLKKNTKVKPFVYSPKISKENLFEKVSKKIVKALMGEMKSYAISGFTDELGKLSNEELKKIKEIINSKLDGNKNKGK